MVSEANGGKSDLKYRSVAEFTLRFGRVFDHQPKPQTLNWGTPKECYANAAMMVIQNPRRYVYCEGTALGVIPVDHAWLYDLRDKRMIDHTWRHLDGSAYIGVAFSFNYLRKIILERETYGPLIDNWHSRWPLLRGEHTEFAHPKLPPVGNLWSYYNERRK